MQSYTRHKLKEDRFVKGTQEAVHWSGEHRNALIIALIVLILAIGAGAGVTTYNANREEKASVALGSAMTTYTAQIRPADAPVDLKTESYPTSADRAKAAHDKFIKVNDDFGSTKNGKFALYMAGVTAIDMGDAAMGERHLKDVADSGDDNSAPLAKLALANLYHGRQKDGDAAKLLKELADADTIAVPRSTAQIQLAEILESKQPQEALKIYEQLLADAKAKNAVTANDKGKGKGLSNTPVAPPQPSPVEQIAQAKIEELKKK